MEFQTVNFEELAHSIIEKFKSRLAGIGADSIEDCKLYLKFFPMTKDFMGVPDGSEQLDLTLIICAPTKSHAAALEMSRSCFRECAKGLGIDSIAFRDDKNRHTCYWAVEE